MKFEILNKFPKGFLGGLAGYIDVTHKQLVDKLGESLGPSSDGKIREEWYLKFPDGTYASIYDWKSNRPISSITKWNVGGSRKSLAYVHAVFGQSHKGIKLLFEEL